MLSLHPFSRPVGLDSATWDYMSVALPAGLVPYRDIFLHKTPGAALLGAAGAAAAGLLGGNPLQGAHLLFLLLGAAGPALLFALCRKRLPLLASLAAAAFLLALDQWPVAAVEGVRPKVATTVFGLASLLAVEDKRPGLAGLLGSLAASCWQPGLAFLGAAAWYSCRGQHCWRCAGLGRLLLAAALVPLGLAAWLAGAGALPDMLEQAVGFNLHYVQRMAHSPWWTVKRLYMIARSWNPAEILLLPMALCGLCRQPRAFPAGLLMQGVLYLLMTFVNLQMWPDTILLAPMLAALLAAGLFFALASACRPTAAAALVLGVALAAAATPASPRLHPPVTFEDQARFMHKLASGLSKNDTVLTIGMPEFLLHTGRRSVWRWPYMWFGVDRFAAEHSSGGFTGMLGRLAQDDPKLILIARHWAGPLRRTFDAWARQRYAQERLRFYPHTSSPIHVYRRRRP